MNFRGTSPLPRWLAEANAALVIARFREGGYVHIPRRTIFRQLTTHGGLSTGIEKRDAEIVAIEAIHKALKSLEPPARQKVLVSVSALLEIPGDFRSAAASPPSGQPFQQSAVEGVRSNPPPHGGRPLSIIELMKEKNPTTQDQFVALFAYYREKHEGLPRFSRQDLKSYFAKAREKPPGNYDRDFVKAVKQGWVHEDGAESYVTSKGVEAVESGFPPESKSKPVKGDKGKRRATRAKRGK